MGREKGERLNEVRRQKLKRLGVKIRTGRVGLSDAIKERDRLIAEELRDGTTERDVAELADVSPARVHQIKEKT